LQALALGAQRVDAVELDPQRLRWVRQDFSPLLPAACIAIRACTSWPPTRAPSCAPAPRATT
jgi:hypothetical protein